MLHFQLCWFSWVTLWTLEALEKFEYIWMSFGKICCRKSALGGQPFEWPIWRSNGEESLRAFERPDLAFERPVPLSPFWLAFPGIRTPLMGVRMTRVEGTLVLAQRSNAGLGVQTPAIFWPGIRTAAQAFERYDQFWPCPDWRITFSSEIHFWPMTYRIEGL